MYDNSRNYGIVLYYFLISDFKYHALNIRNKLKTNDSVQLLKINDAEYLFKNFYKNYNQLIAYKFVCTKINNEVNYILNQEIKNFVNTSLYLKKTNIDHDKCRSLILYDKFNKKNFFFRC